MHKPSQLIQQTDTNLVRVVGARLIEVTSRPLQSVLFFTIVRLHHAFGNQQKRVARI